LLVRRPFNEATVGRSLLNGAIFHDPPPKGAIGSAEMRSSTDGVVRLNAIGKTDATRGRCGLSHPTSAGGVACRCLA